MPGQKSVDRLQLPPRFLRVLLMHETLWNDNFLSLGSTSCRNIPADIEQQISGHQNIYMCISYSMCKVDIMF